ncbi:PREDICTED: protein DCL, chloroplastic-like [Ipomoea nil]|uniref:protein DCL, chloroplastic-like n=1 Tax=Ipomoea nil TaxID=35883 RepID=UPI00090106FB|nr:PREDICTED: protein DCL, chloroplastic-like [Ipomoea nil]
MSESAPEVAKPLSEDMDIESNVAEDSGTENGGAKRPREEGGEPENGDNGDASKKVRVDKSVEEQRLEILEGSQVGEGKKDDKSGPVTLGPKSFGSSVEMFEYCYKLLHHWAPNLDINEYEHMVLLELIKKGHADPQKKIGQGIGAFQVRNHPIFKSRCFFIVRVDGSADDFSFRKCVDRILPLPESMQIKHNANKALREGGSKGGRGGGHGGGKGGRGGGHGRGRGGGHGRGRGKSRN